MSCELRLTTGLAIKGLNWSKRRAIKKFCYVLRWVHLPTLPSNNQERFGRAFNYQIHFGDYRSWKSQYMQKTKSTSCYSHHCFCRQCRTEIVHTFIINPNNKDRRCVPGPIYITHPLGRSELFPIQSIIVSFYHNDALNYCWYIGFIVCWVI